jgi:hypothetical protein
MTVSAIVGAAWDQDRDMLSLVGEFGTGTRCTGSTGGDGDPRANSHRARLPPPSEIIN